MSYEVLQVPQGQQHFLMLDIDDPAWAHDMLRAGAAGYESTYQRVTEETTLVGYMLFFGTAVIVYGHQILPQQVIQRWIDRLRQERDRRAAQLVLYPGPSSTTKEVEHA